LLETLLFRTITWEIIFAPAFASSFDRKSYNSGFDIHIMTRVQANADGIRVDSHIIFFPFLKIWGGKKKNGQCSWSLARSKYDAARVGLALCLM